jgi:hypothetical protein
MDIVVLLLLASLVFLIWHPPGGTGKENQAGD